MHEADEALGMRLKVQGPPIGTLTLGYQDVERINWLRRGGIDDWIDQKDISPWFITS